MGVEPLIILAFAIILLVSAGVRAAASRRTNAAARVDAVLGDRRVRAVIGGALVATLIANFLHR